MTPREVRSLVERTSKRFIDQECASELAKVANSPGVSGEAIVDEYIENCEKFEQQFRDEAPARAIRAVALHQVKRRY